MGDGRRPRSADRAGVASQAKLLAQRGDIEEAERLATRGGRAGGRTDYLDVHARALEDLAEVLRLAGKPQESASRLEEAMRLFELKGNIVAVAGAKARLEALAAAAPPPG